jgi:hypothetical protein
VTGSRRTPVAEAQLSAWRTELVSVGERPGQEAVGREQVLPPDGRQAFHCKRCGVRVEVRAADGRIAQHLTRIPDFTVEKVITIFYGTCRACRATDPGDTSENRLVA